MDEEIIQEFNEKFASVEEALKYIADSQAKSEFVRKRENIESEKQFTRIREIQERTEQNLAPTQRHLDHITKVLRFNIEEYEFQEEKIVEAGNVLSRKRKK